MSTDVSPNLGATYHGAVGAERLSVALIGPDGTRRRALAKALAEDRWANVSEFLAYPTAADDLQSLINQSFNVIALDLDSDPDISLDLVERLSAIDAAPIMVYSQKNDPRLAVRFMRAGAREYLLLPLEKGAAAEALVRIANTVRPKAEVATERMGKLRVFVSAKGGSGVTTVACNLAVALAQEPNQTTLLIDLAPTFGDAALTLGIAAEYSTEDALGNAERLDRKLLHSYLAKHRSGVFVLAAPSKSPEVKVSKDAIDQLVAVALREFDHVIVDVGSRTDLTGTAIFKKATTIYLVALTGVSELRNSSLLISQYFSEIDSKLEVVINRFEPRFLQGLDEDVIKKALGRPVRWTIPEDKDSARQKQFGEVGLAETRILRMGREMAGSITGRPIAKEKKRSFGFKGLGKSIAEEVLGNDDPPSISIAPAAESRETPTLTWSTPGKLTSGDALTADQLNATASVAGTFDYSPALGEVLAAGKHKLSVTFTPTDSSRYTNARTTVSITVSKATPTIEWATPRAIKSGTQLSATQFRATASVPGTFDYSPGLGEVLEAGKHTLTATFTPEDSANYTKAQATVSITVNRATPTVEWLPPQPIECGTQLSAEQLCATATVPGAFDYSPALGEVLEVGTHTLSVLFTPRDDASYSATEATVSITVVRGTPTIEWATPKSIKCGTPLDTTQLCATASVPGKYVYYPALGEVLQAGVHTLSVTFTPRDRVSYSSAEATVSITVVRATPTIEWATPKSIECGILLDATQLCAKASVPGTFDYSPALGTLLLDGTHTLSVIFTPRDIVNYATAEASVSLTVTGKAIPVITWPDPEPIKYGTLLSAKQFSATASVPGSFDYLPAMGELLEEGTHTLSVIFTPRDIANYAMTEASVSLTVVAKETPIIKWSNPEPIAYGTLLGANQFNAFASVPGTFRYSHAPDELLEAGAHTLSVTFTPRDRANYTSAKASVSITVTKIKPVIEWPAPKPMRCGTQLSATELCAKASVPGTFDYSPAPGTLLLEGTHTLSLIFTPQDSASYATAEASVSLTVTAKATPVITWPDPEPIKYGTLLSAKQFSATASVPGSFDYLPAMGELLEEGTHTLSVVFTPRDIANYAMTEASVSLTVVAKDIPIITWSNPEPIAYGTLLGANQFNAFASVPGTFRYSHAPDELLEAGTHTLSVTFTPRDRANYTSAKASVSITVTKIKPVIEWPAPKPMRCGTQLSATELCAKASIPGTFDYSPAPGALLQEGTHTLSLIFTPQDTANCAVAEASVSLTVVAKAVPVITWSTPEPITQGAKLSPIHFSATASVPGTFEYSHLLGEVLEVGSHLLCVTFTPADTTNYATTKAVVPLTVEAKATPVIAWSNPEPITYGTLLSAKQFNASTSVPGTFRYSHALDELLEAGTHTLSVTFTPRDSTNYTNAQAAVLLTVSRAIPTIQWTTPKPIRCGTALSVHQLCAVASVPGVLKYSPALGELLETGAHTLTATFTPKDSVNYTASQATVSLTVEAKVTPVIAWSNPEPIVYGSLLSTVHFSAIASVPGAFDYSHALGELLEAGTHKLFVTFTPTDSANYTQAQASVSLTVTKAIPGIAWSNPDPMVYGTLLNSTQLCATASVPGKFDYSPAADKVLAVGTHILTARFTPADSANYAVVEGAVSLNVIRATPTTQWPAPEPIPWGKALSSNELRAAASVPGSFHYSPAQGEVLTAGEHTLTAIFIPTDSANYVSTQVNVSLTVAKATPTINWPTPKVIEFGTRLSNTELCATASVPGKFDYSPGLGELLEEGSHTLSVTFTPTDGVNYAKAEATVLLRVMVKEVPVICWPTPDPITYRKLLTGTELCATTSVPGTFVYSPALGEVLPAGIHKLTVTFTPTDSTNYATVQATVPITVAKATPSIQWSNPRPIKCGTALTSTQLRAEAWMPGKIVYSPAAGEVLPLGTHLLTATFTPEDSSNNTEAQATVEISVIKDTPSIQWLTPKSIRSGGVLSASQLNATASVPGTFDYSPAIGEVMDVGTHTLSVTFTPTDSERYATALATVSLDVLPKAKPVISWPNPEPISYGTSLNTRQLNATTSIPGTFEYLPGPGVVPPAGMRVLSATFTPADSVNYAPAETLVTLDVTKAKPTIEWPTPSQITAGKALSAKQLCAEASIPGTFEYSPALGEVLGVGRYILSASFTPSDTDNYSTAQTSVALQVEPFRWGRIVAAACACSMLLLLIFLIPMFISKTKPATTPTVQPPSAVTSTPAPVKPNKRKRRSRTPQTQQKIAATAEVQKSTDTHSTSGEKAVNPVQSKTVTGSDQ